MTVLLASAGLSDTFRVVVVVITLTVTFLMPNAIGTYGRPTRVYVLIASVELAFTGLVISTLYHFGDHLRWYGTPLLLVADILALIYIVGSFRHKAWGQ